MFFDNTVLKLKFYNLFLNKLSTFARAIREVS